MYLFTFCGGGEGGAQLVAPTYSALRLPNLTLRAGAYLLALILYGTLLA